MCSFSEMEELEHIVSETPENSEPSLFSGQEPKALAYSSEEMLPYYYQH